MTDEPLPQGRSFQPWQRLHRAEWNPRTIEEYDFKRLCDSIRKRPGFLIRRPILVADGPIHHGGGIIHGGNHREAALEVLFKQGWEPPAELRRAGWFPNYVPVDVDDIPEQEAQALAVIDNNNWAEWQEDQLGEMVYRLGQAGEDLSVLGFDQKEMDRLLASVGVGGGAGTATLGEDVLPDVPAQPVTRRGDLWLLGGHTVCPNCGEHNQIGAVQDAG